MNFPTKTRARPAIFDLDTMPTTLGSIDELASRWRARPDAAVTIALCDALRSTPHPTLVEEVGQRATRDHVSDAAVLLSAARMYMASGAHPARAARPARSARRAR